MPTQPLFNDPFSRFEFAARDQMRLEDDWEAESTTTAIRAGIEAHVKDIKTDPEINNFERWEDLDIDSLPMAALPNGM